MFSSRNVRQGFLAEIAGRWYDNDKMKSECQGHRVYGRPRSLREFVRLARKEGESYLTVGEAIFARRAAAIEIQKWWRGHVIRVSLDSMRKKGEHLAKKSVVLIQRQVRIFLKRKRAAGHKSNDVALVTGGVRRLSSQNTCKEVMGDGPFVLSLSQSNIEENEMSNIATNVASQLHVQDKKTIGTGSPMTHGSSRSPLYSPTMLEERPPWKYWK